MLFVKWDIDSFFFFMYFDEPYVLKYVFTIPKRWNLIIINQIFHFEKQFKSQNKHFFNAHLILQFTIEKGINWAISTQNNKWQINA